MRRRIFSLLLVPAAFCLLAGVVGIGINFLFVISPNNQDAETGCVGLVASIVLLAVGGVSLAGAVATRPADGPQVSRQFYWWGVVAAIMVIPTGLLFGPSGGFHHHVGFGFPFFYMVWNGEDPSPGSLLQIVTGYEVSFNPERFCLLLGIWLGVFAGAVGLVRPTQSREVSRAGSRSDAEPSAAADGGGM